MVREFDGAHNDGSGVIGRCVADLTDAGAFALWVAETGARERGEDVPPELVASTLRWVVDDREPGTVIGTISLVTCHGDNTASARTIERQGGVLEVVTGGIRRYWISLSHR